MTEIITCEICGKGMLKDDDCPTCRFNRRHRNLSIQAPFWILGIVCAGWFMWRLVSTVFFGR